MSEAEAVPQPKKRRRHKQAEPSLGPKEAAAAVNGIAAEHLDDFVDCLCDEALCALVKLTTARFSARRSAIAAQWALPLETGGE